jgi:glycosyltransferase involved in cell wall biosynthesis
MKIAYCISSLKNSGGTERVVTTKMNYLADVMKYEVHVIIKGVYEKSFFSLSDNLIIHYLDAQHNREYRKKTEDKLFEIRPAITISTGSAELGFLYKIKDGSKKIAEFHYSKNYLTHFVRKIAKLRFRKLHLLKVWLMERTGAYYMKKYDKVILLSEKDLRQWKNPKNMCYIHNPVSFRTNRVSSLENKQIIAVGSYISIKGFDLLIKAFHQISAEFPDWTLKIYGNGQDKALLKSLIFNYRLENQVILCNPVPHIETKMQKSSVFAFSSLHEGFGLVLTEAMECGLPCVAFDCNCGPSEILSVDSGFLVEPENIEQFAGSMKKLMEDINLRKQMGENARKEVVRFYPENIMQQWDDLFRQLTSE